MNQFIPNTWSQDQITIQAAKTSAPNVAKTPGGTEVPVVTSENESFIPRATSAEFKPQQPEVTSNPLNI